MLNDYILLVEDDQDLSQLIELILTKNKFNVLTAENILSAKLLLKKHPNIWGGIIDHHLPDGTGLDFLKYARKINPFMINLLLTGETNHELLIECINSNLIYKYIKKPASLDEIVRAVSEINGIFKLQNRFSQKEKDISENLSDYLQQNLKLLQMGQFSLAVMNQLRDPLQIMRLNLDYMKKQKKYSEVALQEIQKNIEVISNSLTFLISYFSPSGMLQKEYIPVEDSITEISTNLIQLLKNPQKINFKAKFSEKPTEIYFNSSQFEQIIHSLLQNSIEAAMLSKEPKVSITTYKDNSYFYIKFSDNGPGIPEDVQDHIFNPFFSGKRSNQKSIWREAKSTIGLGIWLCNLIVKDYGGSISFETGSEGTVFTIILPLLQIIKKSI